MTGLVLRPARPSDLPELAALTGRAYTEVDRRTFQRDWADPRPRSPERDAAWARRTGHALETDPEGCWVAELDGRVVGCAVSRVRELMWLLSSFAVAPEVQGRGVGTQLLAAALSYGRGCLRGMFAASADPAAVRRYRLAGFDLHPQMFATGTVDRDALPLVGRVREGSAGDIDLMDSIDRRTRGAAHLSDHEVLLAQFRLVVSETSSSQGYAYVDDSGSPVLVAATTRRAASDLVWEAFASSAPGSTVSLRHVTAANQWAVDVALAARLSVHTSGYLCLRGMRPPAPYVHHGSML